MLCARGVGFDECVQCSLDAPRVLGGEIVSSEGLKDMDSIGDGDVVILPAFGASLEEMQTLSEKNVQIVDTTCPWVSKVWNTVDKHTKVRRERTVRHRPFGKKIGLVQHRPYHPEQLTPCTCYCMRYLLVTGVVLFYVLLGRGRGGNGTYSSPLPPQPLKCVCCC